MSTVRKVLIALAVLVVCMASAGGIYHLDFHHGPASAAVASQKKKPSTTPTCLQKKGSFCTGVALKAVTREDLASFTRGTRVFPAIVEYYQAFGKPFSKINARRIALLGARPLIQINPHKIDLADIAAGHYDAYLRQYALALKSFGHQVVLSFGHEMNGTWSTWGLPFTKPAVFVAAWRHIHDVFAAEHVGNVTWSWDISHTAHPPRPWWPGSKYTDWVGIDGYLRPGQTFAGQFWKSINTVRKFSNKPVIIAETAVAPGKDQIKQMNGLFAGARERHLVGLVWFDVNKKAKWKIDNARQEAAFRQDVWGSPPRHIR
jgi:mannan endo-1,4-beta-mannosidase